MTTTATQSTSTPLVSIIVRTKDRPRFLRAAVESIQHQDYPAVEVIIVNDGGCDLDIAALEKSCDRLRFQYIRHDHCRGRSQAAAAGLEKVSGQYFGFLDDDDTLLPHHVSTLVQFLQKSDYRIAYSNVEEYRKVFDPQSQQYQSTLIHTYAHDFNAIELLFYNYIPFNALLFHRQLIPQFHFDPELELYEDWDLLIRLSLKQAFYHIDRVTAIYNKWSDDLQINNLAYTDTMRRNQAIIIKRYQHNIPAEFLRNLWSQFLEQKQSIDGLKKENRRLNQVIDEYQQVINGMEQVLGERANRIDELQQHVLMLQQQRDEQNNKLEAVQKHLQEHIQTLGQSRRHLNEIEDKYQRQLKHQQQLLESEQLQRQQQQQQMVLQQEQLQQLQNELQQIHISLSWRLIKRLRRLIEIVLPVDSARRRLYHGLRAALSRAVRSLLKRPLPAPQNTAQLATDTSAAHELATDNIVDIHQEKNIDTNNIILISHDFHRAGAQINLLHGAKVLKQLGKRIIFVALKDGMYHDAFAEVADEIHVLYPDTPQPFQLNEAIEQLFRNFKQRGISQCICNTVLSGAIAPLLHKLEFNAIYLIHELPVTINIYDLHLAVCQIREYGQQIVFSSAYAKNSYIENYQYPAEKCLIKPQGCYFAQSRYDTREQAGKQLREKLLLPPSSKIIITCGHLYTRKGPDAFLSLAWHLLQHRDHQHFHFVWLGGHEKEDYNWFIHDKQKMGIDPHVHYVNFVEDPNLYYAGADVFVLTAREDPFPTVVLEAMNNGTPVIAFEDAGGIPELLRDNCGLSCAFLDIPAMARCVLQLLDDQPLYQEISQRGRQRVVEEYNFENYMQYLLSLLDNNSLEAKQQENNGQENQLAFELKPLSQSAVQDFLTDLIKPPSRDPQYCDFAVHQPLDSEIKLLAFYLPQFHPIAENDKWWGKGFTEWTNVSRAKPQFKGHYQPRLPGELGFYDLRLPEISLRQVELAKNYGIYGFCFYHYWFSGRRILEKPLDLMLANSQWNMPFCLCWANENWSRRWDGSEDDILMEQKYLPEDDLKFIQDLAIYLQDQRYIRISGKPLLLVYRPDLLPDAKKTAAIWRQWCRENGIGEIYLCNVHSFDHQNPEEIDFDASIEFPPNLFPLDYANDQIEPINPNYAGKVYQYPQLLDIANQYQTPDYKKFRGITPSWDNEARRTGRGTSFINSTPGRYYQWLQQLCHYTHAHFPCEEKFIFVNAWNEWAEGACLEPDQKFGYAYLQASYQALQQFDHSRLTLLAKNTCHLKKKNKVAIIIHLYYFDLWQEINSYLQQMPENYDLYISVGDKVDVQNIQTIYADQPHARLFAFENKGRDVFPFIRIFQKIQPLNYQAICKIHSKKSTHTDVGDSWRRNIYESLLGSPKTIAAILKHLKKHKKTGLIAPKGYILRLSDCLGLDEAHAQKNLAHMQHLLQQLDTTVDTSEIFITGTMFWFKPQALKKFMQLPLADKDFPVEKGQVDGTIMHALERIIPQTAKLSGFNTIDSTEIMAKC